MTIQDQDKFFLRLPDGMRDEIKAAAAANGRSMNAEIVASLSASGETLRDKFAMAALPAVITATSAGQHLRILPDGKGIRQAMAEDAYYLADAMMEARKGR